MNYWIRPRRINRWLNIYEEGGEWHDGLNLMIQHIGRPHDMPGLHVGFGFRSKKLSKVAVYHDHSGRECPAPKGWGFHLAIFYRDWRRPLSLRTWKTS